jgi:hypothetical protein
MDRAPTHHDAELVLRLYELRREPVMREHRNVFLRQCWPLNEADAVAILALDHPMNVAYRQVTTYWEMAFALCRHGTLHPDLLLDSSGEGLFAYARLEPYLGALRARTNPRTLQSTEWIANETALGRVVMETMRGRVAQVLAARR